MASRPRMTGGRLKGRPLPTPIPAGARPTSARVREAMFSMVGHDLRGLRILDAFGGSGLLGLEAWSRGAEVVLVERDKQAIRAVRKNIEVLGASVEVHIGDVHCLASGLGDFDGVLVDPPYALPVEPILRVLSPLAGRWLMLESDAHTEVPAVAPGLSLARSRQYGGTALHLYWREHD